jgi:Tetratricopeptide repeat
MMSPATGQAVKLFNDTGARLFASGDIKGAYHQFSQALALDPDSDLTLNNLGIAYLHAGHPKRAFQTLCKAMRISPSDPQIVLNCGKVAGLCGMVAEFSSLYLTCAQQRYDNEVMGFFIDTTLMQNGRTRSVRAARRRPNQVVFVANKPISREAKLACGLKQAGFEVVLIHHEEPNFDASRYCIETLRYRTPAEALELAWRFNPMVFHVFATWNYAMPALLIRNKPGKIVIDDYDVMAGMVKGAIARRDYPGNLELERYCLENADGLCCRSLEPQFAKRYMGYFYRGKKLFLLDGCWSNCAAPGNRAPKISDGKVHMVYCGNISTEITGPYDYHQDVAVLLSSHGIHYHIYPYYAHCRAILVPKLNDYVMKNGGNPACVHVHPPVASDDLTREISRYHYGLHLMWPNPRSNQADFPYELRGFDYGSTNKIFDYMDAGLPIFVHPGRLQKFLVERYGSGSAICDLSDLLVTTIPDPLPVPVAFQMEPNIRRLIRFYEAL